MKQRLTGFVLIAAAMAFTGCARDASTAESGGRPAAVAQSGGKAPRGSLSPSAPVNLQYTVPGPLAADQPASIEVTLTTPLTSGAMVVVVDKAVGATLLGPAQYRIDLAGVAQPIPLTLKVLPAAVADRYLVLLVMLDSEFGPMSATFRIDLTAPSAPEHGS